MDVLESHPHPGDGSASVRVGGTEVLRERVILDENYFPVLRSHLPLHDLSEEDAVGLTAAESFNRLDVGRRLARVVVWCCSWWTRDWFLLRLWPQRWLLARRDSSRAHSHQTWIELRAARTIPGGAP